MDPAEWYFLLTGGVAMSNPRENPASEWLTDKQWGEFCRISDMPAFEGLADTFSTELVADWQAIYDSSNAHECLG